MEKEKQSSLQWSPFSELTSTIKKMGWNLPQYRPVVVKLVDEVVSTQWYTGYQHDQIDWKKWEIVSYFNGAPNGGVRMSLPDPPFVIKVNHSRRCWGAPESDSFTFFIKERGVCPKYFPLSYRDYGKR